MEHSNIMLGCSIDGCYMLMILTYNGMEVAGQTNYAKRTIICIGLSTENVYFIPTNEIEEGGETQMSTLPILEYLNDAYRGRIEMDYYRNTPFDENSGRNIEYTIYGQPHYTDDAIVHGRGTVL